MNLKFYLFLVTIFSYLLPNLALADFPHQWQIGFQKPASLVMEKLHHFHNMLLVITFAIVIFVTLLIAYVCIKFSKKNNPIPSKTTHHTLIEILWTTIPVIILIIIAVPSFKILYYMDKTTKPEMTLKVIAHQWYWEYNYPNHHNTSFDSYIIKDADLKPGQIRLLEVDNRVVLPINTDVQVLVTSADVIHSWSIPSLGIKTDAVPGRTNETWLNITEPGVYYGQCSELCGIDHGFMPIAIEAKTKADFDLWVQDAEKKFAVQNSHPLALN